ncbi:MAG: internal scaffolding protein [Microvirus sp.]|nr:MAG: internal scaffolding protein [Microvirus sp.]
MKRFLRSDGNYDTNEASDASGLKCLDKTRTQQHLAEETDINFIVKRYLVSGEVPQHQLPPLNADFNQVSSLQEALDLVVEARESFQSLDADVRARFRNDPIEFVAFMENPKNADEIRKMGLWSPEALASWDTKDKAAKAAYKALEEDAAAYRATTKATPKGVT